MAVVWPFSEVGATFLLLTIHIATNSIRLYHTIKVCVQDKHFHKIRQVRSTEEFIILSLYGTLKTTDEKKKKKKEAKR